MRLLFSERAWEDDLHWQAKVEKTLERLNTLIRESSRTPLQGIGMPELLRGNLSGWWQSPSWLPVLPVYRRTAW